MANEPADVHRGDGDYVTDVAYARTFVDDLAPIRLRHVAALNGFRGPRGRRARRLRARRRAGAVHEPAQRAQLVTREFQRFCAHWPAKLTELGVLERC